MSILGSTRIYDTFLLLTITEFKISRNLKKKKIEIYYKSYIYYIYYIVYHIHYIVIVYMIYIV